MAVLDCSLKPILPLSEYSIYIGDVTFDVTMPDHTMRKYDIEGTLINDFYIANVRMLEYEKEEIIYRKNTTMDTGDGYEGLITADGH